MKVIGDTVYYCVEGATSVALDVSHSFIHFMPRTNKKKLNIKS
jgi:hypothetical protein